MKKYKAIIYDIDGTLLDTLKMNMYPLMKIIKEETGEDWTFEQVLKFAAYPGMKVMEELGVKDQEKTYARWVQYVNDYEDGATLFEGFEEVLETFKNKKIKQAIVSSKLREQYEIDIVSKGIDQYMEAVILQDDTTFHKPHPEPLLKCIEKLNLKPEEVIYIGDAHSDYEASKNAHIDFGLFIHDYDRNLYEGIPLKSTNSLDILAFKVHPFASKKIIAEKDLKDEKIMVARQAMQNQEIPDFIDNKQIVAIFDLPENVKIMVKENIPLYHWHLIKKKKPTSLLQKNFIEILKSEY